VVALNWPNHHDPERVKRFEQQQCANQQLLPRRRLCRFRHDIDLEFPEFVHQRFARRFRANGFEGTGLFDLQRAAASLGQLAPDLLSAQGGVWVRATAFSLFQTDIEWKDFSSAYSPILEFSASLNDSTKAGLT